MNNISQEKILFYNRGEPYYEFTNFAEGYPINFPSLPGYKNLAGSWSTSEHAFQAAKFIDNKEIVERFRSLKSPREAFILARNLAKGENGETKTNIINNWHGTGSGSWENNGNNAKKIEVMQLVVEQKIFQHEHLKNLLWKTGDKDIIEDTDNDSSQPENRRDNCWGNARGGKNWLGKILMRIRNKIVETRGKYKPTTEPKKTKTGEDDTTHKNQAKQTLIKKNISEIKNKLSSAKITPEQEIQILGNSWETNYKMSWVRDSETEIENHKNSLLAKISEFITNNPNHGTNNNNNNQNQHQNPETNEPNTPPPPPEPTNSPAPPTPTAEQINQTEQKLDQAQANNLSEEELISIIKQTSETVKHSGDENLKKKKEEAEKKLSKDKLRALIREEIHQELTENGVKPEQFDPQVKQKLDELNNNNNNNNDQVIRTEVLNEIGKQKLCSLIKTLEQALKAGQKTKVKNHLKELQQFINSKIDYKQNAYAKEKNKVQRLLTQANQQLNSPNQTKTSFFHPHNPLLWLSALGLVIVFGIGWLIIRVRRRRIKV